MSTENQIRFGFPDHPLDSAGDAYEVSGHLAEHFTPQTAYALRCLLAERRKQDHQWGGPAYDDRWAPEDWIAILTKHLGKAAAAALDEDVVEKSGNEAAHHEQMLVLAHRLTVVAAVAVAAVESIGRGNFMAQWYADRPPTAEDEEVAGRDGTVHPAGRQSEDAECTYSGVA